MENDKPLNNQTARRFTRTAGPLSESPNWREKLREVTRSRVRDAKPRIETPESFLKLIDDWQSHEKRPFVSKFLEILRERVFEATNSEEGFRTGQALYRLGKATYRETLNQLYEDARQVRNGFSQFYESEPQLIIWIKGDGSIMKNLNRHCNQHFLPILRDLIDRVLPISESEVYLQTKIMGKLGYRALVKPDTAGMAKRLEISRSLIDKYIQGGVDNGFWQWFTPQGHRKYRGAYLVMGRQHYYIDPKTKETRVNTTYFLANPKIRSKLLTFEYPH